MKTRHNFYTVFIVLLLLIQHFISGCATKVSTDVYRKDTYKEEMDLVSQNLFQEKCSLCHELPDIDDFSSKEWTGIIDYTHDTKATRKFITIDEAEKIKGYLMSDARSR